MHFAEMPLEPLQIRLDDSRITQRARQRTLHHHRRTEDAALFKLESAPWRITCQTPLKMILCLATRREDCFARWATIASSAIVLERAATMRTT
eukprot:8774775-Pyramimonas_sp.AAC.1